MIQRPESIDFRMSEVWPDLGAETLDLLGDHVKIEKRMLENMKLHYQRIKKSKDHGSRE